MKKQISNQLINEGVIKMKKFTKVLAAALAAAVITISAGTTGVSVNTEETACDTQYLNDMGVDHSERVYICTKCGKEIS